MGIVRPREVLAVRNPDVEGHLVILNPADVYDDDDPIVLAYPAEFASDAELYGGNVEDATARPGRKRSTRRSPAK